jgi:hypothetical protein
MLLSVNTWSKAVLNADRNSTFGDMLDPVSD